MPLAPFPQRASKLDRAIFASVAAMLAMNVAVLTQQLNSGMTALNSAGLA